MNIEREDTANRMIVQAERGIASVVLRCFLFFDKNIYKFGGGSSKRVSGVDETIAYDGARLRGGYFAECAAGQRVDELARGTVGVCRARSVVGVGGGGEGRGGCR